MPSPTLTPGEARDRALLTSTRFDGEPALKPALSPRPPVSLLTRRIPGRKGGPILARTNPDVSRDSDTASQEPRKSRCYSEVALGRSVVGADARRVADARRGRCVAHEDGEAARRRGPGPGTVAQSTGVVRAPRSRRSRRRISDGGHAPRVDLADPLGRQRGARGDDERDPRVAHR